jgi:hypothetical protein
MESSASPAPHRRRIPGLPNPVVAAAQQKWLFTDEELERTPSRIDNISRGEEDHIRHRAVEFIWQVSMMLKMPPQTSMTATVFMHRFLMRYSLQGHYPEISSNLMHPKVIAGVALFVAFKVDETMRRMKDFVIACCRVALKQADMIVDEQSKDYWKWRDLLLQNESTMLEVLCFDLQLESPYRILWDYSLFFNVQDNRPLRHAAYAFLNDSTYTVLCLRFSPRVIAAAALYAAARHCNVAFPDDDEGRPWWVRIDVRIDDLIRACKLIVQIYERVHQHLSKGYPDFAISDPPIPQDPTRLSQDPPSTATSADAPPNGRKRSREPESFSGSLPSRIPEQPPRNGGGRSPKRQRTVSPGTGQDPKTSTAEPPLPRIPKKALASATSQSKHPSKATSAPAKDDTTTEEGEVVSDERTPSRPKAAQPADSIRSDPQKGDVDDEGGGGSEEGEI